MRRVGSVILLGVSAVCLSCTTAFAQPRPAPEQAKGAPPGPDAPQMEVFLQKPDLERLVEVNNRLSRRHFRAEYHFISKACALTPEQEKIIAQEGEKAYQDVIFDLAERTASALQNGKPVPSRDDERIEREIRGKLTEIAKSHVTPDQAKKLGLEDEKRKATRRALSIEATLYMIDRELVLTDMQYDEIRRSLHSQWKDDFLPRPELLLYDRLNLPVIPDKCVISYLTDSQKIVWSEISQRHPANVTSAANAFLRDNNSLESDLLRVTHDAESRARKEARQAKARETAE